ncbi:GTP-binding protein, partial [Intestinibacter sp.]|uniref:GTP-binding protein n=1 Tax=Intestinibacter sp. TaxID=1965304 RepID=UPI003F15F5A8
KSLNSRALIIDNRLDEFNINDIIYKKIKHKNSDNHTAIENNLDLSSYTFNVDRVYSEEQIYNLLSEFINFSKYGLIVRAKGIINATKGGYLKFDYVDGEVHTEKITNTSETSVVVIGQNLNKKRIYDSFKNLS